MTKIPLLNSLKPFGSQLHALYLLPLPNDSTYGNILFKWSGIVNNVENLNYSLQEFSDYFDTLVEDIRNGKMISLPNRYHFLIEQIIYWLRKIADELISTYYLGWYFQKHTSYPEKITVDSIGTFLKNPFSTDLSKFNVFLKNLNSISNTYKHGFINAQLSGHLPTEYPIIFSYHLPCNDLSKIPKSFETHNLENILIEYDKFLGEMKKLIKEVFKV